MRCRMIRVFDRPATFLIWALKIKKQITPTYENQRNLWIFRSYCVLDYYFLFVELKHQRLDVRAQRQLKLLGFLDLAERERA